MVFSPADHVYVLRFFVDGERIRGEDTSDTLQLSKLQLEDGDQIDCMLEQFGGYSLTLRW